MDFLTDAAKISFGSAVVGFFIPGIGVSVTTQAFAGGVFTTVVCLVLATLLDKRVLNRI